MLMIVIRFIYTQSKYLNEHQLYVNANFLPQQENGILYIYNRVKP